MINDSRVRYSGVQQRKATLQSINTHGTAILLVEQNMEVALALAAGCT